MSESANRRVQAISKQLAPTIPAITKIGPDSNGPRAAGKVVIITGISLLFRWRHAPIHETNNGQGANSILGIGRASAHQFAQNGARAVYICDYDDSNLETHQKEINAAYPNVDVHVRQLDAAEEKAVQAVVDDAIQRYGRLDVFFANAGVIGPMSLFTDVDADDFMETFRVNTLG